MLFDKCAADTAAAYQEASDTIIVVVLNLCRVSRNQKGAWLLFSLLCWSCFVMPSVVFPFAAIHCVFLPFGAGGERQVTSSFHATRVCLNEDIVEVKNLIAKWVYNFLNVMILWSLKLLMFAWNLLFFRLLRLKGRAKPVATQFSQSSSTQQSSVSEEVVLCSHDIVPIDKIINQAIVMIYFFILSQLFYFISWYFSQIMLICRVMLSISNAS